ncbi:Protein of unknown function DUF748 [Nitrosococcus oceani ATCC 19707]|uniref:OmpA-like domain-containing protein n=3 Tax=Nitrosococcus oceani TaxID=1229 RepID=Q3JBN6_NITOC|nr:Protein of unknown function DUF748 [Nitrosococcus oceani ATCC 19707]EDZ68541.1 conserved domain protein [Nitrosococcus oceani AFC27]KFI19848.1 hypothetical protein IB75_06570 [Nitrosococcus oceani C-27]
MVNSALRRVRTSPAWIRKRWVRNSALGVVIILLIYTLVGFFLVPYLLEKQLINYLKENLGVEAKVKEITLNPYALTLAVNNFSFHKSGHPKLFGFKQFYANFELSSIFRKAWAFQKISLTKPYLRLQINKNGQVNLAELLPADETPALKERKKEVPLTSDQILITGGDIHFIDLTQPTPFEKKLEAINVDLKKFSTLPENDGSYSFKATTQAGEILRWKGEVTLSPLHSKGTFELVGGKARTLWKYLRDQVAFEITSGRMDGRGNYTLESQERGLQIILKGVTFALTQLGLKPKEGNREILTVPKLGFSGGQLRWPEKIIGVKFIYMGGTQVRAWLNKQGALNWQKLFKSKKADRKMTESTANSSSLSWRAAIKKIKVENVSASLQDRTIEPPATLNISDLGLQLIDVTSVPGLASTFNLQFHLNKQGQLLARGHVTALPPSADLEIHLESLSLLPFQPYLNRFLKLKLISGNLEAKGNVAYAQSNDAPNFQFKGDLVLQKFAAEDTLLDERFLGWENLKFERVLVGLFPSRIHIDNIALDAPYGKVTINENKKINIKEVLSPLAGKKESQSADPSSTSASKPLPIAINSIRIKKGSANFADLSVSPKFSMGIHSLQSEIQNLSSMDQGRSSISLEGTVESYGEMSMTGKSNLFALERATEFSAFARNIALPEFTPYATEFLGYPIEKGKLSLDLTYRIKEDQIQGKNGILLKNLDLGKKVESPKAIDAPIKLAIGLLKDSQGKIAIQVPIEGNLNAPKFSYGHLIGEALTGVIGKVISSPFRLLGSLVGAKEDVDLGFIEFRPMGSKLLPPAQEKLLQLAKALKKRPELQLQIQGRYDPITDSNFWKKEKFEVILSDQLKQQSGASDKGKNALVRQQALEQLYLKQFSIKSLNQQRAQYGLQPVKTGAGNVEPNNASSLEKKLSSYRKALEKKLIEAQPVSKNKLQQLGQERANAIKAYLVSKGGIQEKRLGILQVESTQSPAKDFVRCQLHISS